nr:unnamed protein product [Callosobruchus analis]
METIEHNRQQWYDIMINNKQNDRKPPPTTCSRSSMHISDLVDSSNMVMGNCDKLDASLPPVNLPATSSFQTAAGKILEIPDNDIKKQAVIFQDIEWSAISGHIYKVKQHHILQKFNTGHKAESLIAKSLNMCTLENNISEESMIKRTNTVAGHSCAEFGTSSDAKCPIPTTNADSDAFSKNRSISSSQEIGKPEISDAQLLSIVNDNSIHQKGVDAEDSDQPKLFHKNISISLSQQIREFGVSNTQMMSVVEDYLSKCSQSKYGEPNNFVGFSKKDPEESNMCAHQMSNVIRKITNIKNNSTENDITRKRFLEVDHMPDSKRIKLVPFPDINPSNFNIGFGRFSSASGKHINVTTKAPTKPNHTFDDINQHLGNMVTHTLVKDADTYSNKNLKLDTKSQQQCTDLEARANSFSEKQAQNIQRSTVVTGEKVQKSDVAYKSNMNNFPLTSISCKANNENAHPGFATASGKLLVVHKMSKMKVKQVFGDILDSTLDDTMVKITSKRKLKVLDDAENKAELFVKNDITETPNSSTELKKYFGQNVPKEKTGLINASGKSFQVSNSSLAKAKQMFEDLYDNKAESANRRVSKSKFKLLDEAIRKVEVNMGLLPSSVDNDFQKKNIKSRPFALSTLPHKSPLQSLLSKPHIADSYHADTPKKGDEILEKGKRKLGLSSCKQITILPQNLMQAKLLFDQELDSISPIKPIQLNNQHSYNTPESPKSTFSIAYEKYCSTPLQNNNTSKNLPVIPPAKRICKEFLKLNPGSFFIFGAPTKGSMSDWLQKYHQEIKLIEERLTKIKERESALSRLYQAKRDDKRRCLGVLYQKKISSSRLNLRLCYDEISNHEVEKQDLFFVSPENAADFHFK